MKKYYVEITNEKHDYILQSRWFKTRKAAIQWARGISYLYREDDVFLMSAVFHGDEHEDIYQEDNIRDEIYNH